MTAFDAAVLLVADGLVAAGRVLGRFRRPCVAEKRTQAARDADRLTEAEQSRDSWEPDELWVPDGSSALVWPEPEVRSAAVSRPAADNTPDCGCGSARLLRNPETLKRLLNVVNEDASVEVLLEEDTAAVDGTQLADSLEAAWNYHKGAVGYAMYAPDGVEWYCEGCKWTGRTEQAHNRHRFQVIADMTAATHRVQQQLGGAS